MVDVVLFLFNTDDGRCSLGLIYTDDGDVVLFLFNTDDGRCSLVLI